MADNLDLSALEKAYAENPSGDAFIPLSMAYLQQGRFMEAMVVAKKGIKNQPDNVQGRLLLGRVYAEQGKVPKALEEVKGLLEQKPDVAEAHYFHALMLDKSGKTDEAVEEYKATLLLDRKHEAAAAAIQAKGIDWSPGPSPEEIAAAEAAKRAEEEAKKRAEEEAAAAAAAAAEAAKQAEAAAAAAAQQKSAPRPRAPASSPASSGASNSPTPRTTPPLAAQQFPANDPAFQGYAGAYGFVSGPVPVVGGGRRLGPGFTFGLGALLLLVIVGFVALLKINKAEKEKIAEHLKAAQKGVQADTTTGHKLAIRELDEALKVDDSQSLAAAQRALSLSILAVERGDKELDAEAKKATERASKVADDQPGTVAARMLWARADGKPEEGIALAQKLNADSSALPIAVRIQLGRTYAAMGKVDDMVKLAESMKDIPDPGALTFVGESFRRVGEKIRARNALDGALKNALDHDPARAARALLILETDDITNLGVALDDLRTLKDLGKEAVGTRQRGYASLGMAMAGRRIGRAERENESEAQAARAMLRTDPEVPLFDAKYALAQGDNKKAMELCLAAINIDKVRLEPYLTLVDAASRAKEWAAADKALADAATVFGDNLELGLAKAGRLRDQDRPDDALQSLSGLLAKYDMSEVHRDIGKVLLKKGDNAGAVASLKKAAEKATTRAPGIQANVYMWLGRALATAEDHENAVEAYGQALSATSEFSTTYYFLGNSLAKIGKGGAAKEAYDKYLKADPNGTYVEQAKQKRAEL
jgi:cellulose synthase operon protein C